MNRRQTSLLAIPLLLITFPAAAHHAFTMFDSTKTVTLLGEVKELQWANPHVYLQVLVPNQGKVTEWSIQMQSTMAMFRAGWRPLSLRPGDKVTVVVNPMRDGTSAGSFVSAIDPSGKSWTIQRPAP